MYNLYIIILYIIFILSKVWEDFDVRETAERLRNKAKYINCINVNVFKMFKGVKDLIGTNQRLMEELLKWF